MRKSYYYHTNRGESYAKKCSVYIDESGDLGANRGTQWFVLTAVIVDKEKEDEIRQTISSIRFRLNIQNIHFRNIKDFSRKSYVVRELAKHDFTYMNVLFDTNKFDRSKITTESIAYNYICRYLIERVSWYLRDTDRVGDIVLSSRGTSKDGELVKYIREKLIEYEFNEISDRFDNITSHTASSWDMLQLADVCATTMFLSYEKNGFGFIVPCFSKCLKSRLYTRNGTIVPYGIKYFSDDMKPDAGYYYGLKICDGR